MKNLILFFLVGLPCYPAAQQSKTADALVLPKKIGEQVHLVRGELVL